MSAPQGGNALDVFATASAARASLLTSTAAQIEDAQPRPVQFVLKRVGAVARVNDGTSFVFESFVFAHNILL